MHCAPGWQGINPGTLLLPCCCFQRLALRSAKPSTALPRTSPHTTQLHATHFCLPPGAVLYARAAWFALPFFLPRPEPPET